MKFVEIIEDFETFVSKVGNTIAHVNGFVNIDNIELIRQTSEGILVFLIGRDKALKITDEASVKAILKECKIKSINE